MLSPLSFQWMTARVTQLADDAWLARCTPLLPAWMVSIIFKGDLRMFQTAFQFIDLLSLSDLDYQRRVAVIRDIFLTGRFDPDRINGAPGNPVELRKLNDLYMQLQTMGLARLRCRFDEDEIHSMSHAYAMMY